VLSSDGIPARLSPWPAARGRWAVLSWAVQPPCIDWLYGQTVANAGEAHRPSLLALSHSLVAQRRRYCGVLLRRCEGATLVLAPGYEVGRGVHSGHLPAFEDVSELVLTVLLPVGTGRELHVVLLNLIVDGLFALLVRRGPGIGRRGRAEGNDGGANGRYQP
jgi:hypothetical protein